MAKNVFSLMNVLEGYVRNYRGLKLLDHHAWAVFTQREIAYFAQLGEYLGFFSFIEDGRPQENGRSRPMDLAWWQWDERKDTENYTGLILHLERENIADKCHDTLDKLFADSGDDYKPASVIGIQAIESEKKIKELNDLVIKKNRRQMSQVLMVYRFYDKAEKFDRVWAYNIQPNGKMEERKMICFVDKTGCYAMCFEEEYERRK